MYSSRKLSMTLLPKVPGLQLENVAIDAKTVLLSVASTRPSASCRVFRPENNQAPQSLPSHRGRSALGRLLGKALDGGQEILLLRACVPATDLRRAPGFRGRVLC